MTTCFIAMFIFNTDADDFDKVTNHILSFDITETKQCHNISILDDNICECGEHFVSNLTTDEHNVDIAISMIDVYIEDHNEAECRKS